MNHTPEHIDDIFRKRLHDAAPPPPAFVWDNVERELRKRRRRFFFWIFSLGMVGIGLLGSWLAFTGGGERQLSLARPEQETNMIRPEVVSEGPAAALTVHEQLPSKDGGEKILAEPVFAKQVNHTTTTTKRAGTPRPLVSVTPLPFQAAQLKLDAGTELVTETSPQSLEINPQKTISLGDGTQAGFNLNMLPVNSSAPLQPGTAMVKAGASLHQLWPVTLKSHASKSKAKKAVKNCYDFTKQPSAWLVEAYAGPSLAQRELVTSPDNRPYLNKRLSSEHRDLAFNAGVRASLMLKGNFLLRTGVQYDQMTEVFEYVDPDWVKTSVVYFTQNGVTTVDTIVEYGEKYQKTYNRFGLLDIPVLVGIELRKGRSGFNINAGMSFNVMFWKRGAILSPDSGAPEWFTPGKGTLEVFRPKAGLSASASIQWFYHLKPRLRVFVEPYFKKVLRPVTVSSHPVEQRYGIGGLRLGVTKILN